MIQTVGAISGIIMALFNIPLIVRMIRRRPSEDSSLVWVVGARICVIGRVLHSLHSPDSVLLTFGIVNGLFITGVSMSVLIFHLAIMEDIAAQQLVERRGFYNRVSFTYGSLCPSSKPTTQIDSR